MKLVTLVPHICLSRSTSQHFCQFKRKKKYDNLQQEYIPVGCVPTAALTTTKSSKEYVSVLGGAFAVHSYPGVWSTHPYLWTTAMHLVTPPIECTPQLWCTCLSLEYTPCLCGTFHTSGVRPLPLVYTPTLEYTPWTDRHLWKHYLPLRSINTRPWKWH